MSSRPSHLIVATMVVASIAGCSLLVETSGLRGGEEQDASVEIDARDGKIEVGTRDSGGAVPPPCTDGPTRFCDDFDDSNPGDKWTTSFRERGNLTYDKLGLSAPHAFSGELVSGAGDGVAALQKEFAGPPGTIGCAFDLKIGRVGKDGETVAFEIQTYPATSNGPRVVGTHAVSLLNLNGTATWSLEEYQSSAGGQPVVNRSTPVGDLPTGSWIHVAIAWTTSSVKLTTNGSIATLDALKTPTDSVRRGVSLGITFAAATVQAGSLSFDNVDCTMAQ